MKNIVLAAAFSAAASAGFAGSISEPIMEPEVIVEEASGSSGGDIIVPLLLLLVIAAAASN
jgi:hypothetical protein